MAKINLNKPFKAMNGEVLKDGDAPIMMNVFIANVIAGNKNDKPAVALGIAQRVYNADGEIEVNAIELTILEQAAKNENITALVAGQLLKELGKEEE